MQECSLDTPTLTTTRVQSSDTGGYKFTFTPTADITMDTGYIDLQFEDGANNPSTAWESDN